MTNAEPRMVTIKATQISELLLSGSDIGWNQAMEQIRIHIDHYEKIGQLAKAETLREVLHNIGKVKEEKK